MSSSKIDIVAAVTSNRIIGSDGGMPFRLSTDLKRFKALTLGKPVIMGRKTYESIGKALPGRLNIVVTRSPNFAAEGVVVAASLETAIALASDRAREDQADTICIIGGGEIYAQAMALADRLLITHIVGDIDGDTYFPVIDQNRFRAVSEEFVPAGDKDSHATRFVVYEKTPPSS
jgi:dihydrofolate reductase